MTQRKLPPLPPPYYARGKNNGVVVGPVDQSWTAVTPQVNGVVLDITGTQFTLPLGPYAWLLHAHFSTDGPAAFYSHAWTDFANVALPTFSQIIGGHGGGGIDFHNSTQLSYLPPNGSIVPYGIKVRLLTAISLVLDPDCYVLIEAIRA